MIPGHYINKFNYEQKVAILLFDAYHIIHVCHSINIYRIESKQKVYMILLKETHIVNITQCLWSPIPKIENVLKNLM